MGQQSVSVIIPTHNAANTLDACLKSIFAAKYDGPVEVIVVDDCSSDRTRDIASVYDCRLVRRSKSGGPAVARNSGARVAQHDLLLFVDSDTEMLADTIEQGVRALQQPGIAAVTGMYEREPINEGFSQRYYSYLKRYTFERNRTDEISAFGAQCAIISKQLFREVGGFRAIAWGVDVENDELGSRVSQHGTIALCQTFSVKHNFPRMRKLFYIFTGRVYWWILFSHFSKRAETVLMTRGFGYATAALPAALLCFGAAAFTTHMSVTFLWHVGAMALFTMFVNGYVGFWAYCLKHRGKRFAAGAALLSAIAAIVITCSAARGYFAVLKLWLQRREPAYAQAALGQV